MNASSCLPCKGIPRSASPYPAIGAALLKLFHPMLSVIMAVLQLLLEVTVVTLHGSAFDHVSGK
jgi:hypothetical protein